MNQNFLICKKDEAYTYDEISFVKEIVSDMGTAEEREGLLKKLETLLSSLESNRNGMAVFFMPKNSFDVFALFQGDNSLCEIIKDDIFLMHKLVLANSNGSEKMKDHVASKLSVLFEFLQQGNEIKPVLIPCDVFVNL